METIFTKIIQGEIPAHRVYEDSHCIGILDIHPVTPGHTLIIPKKQVDRFTDMDEKDFVELSRAAQSFAKHMQKVLGCQRVVWRIEGFDVPHVHIHLVPVNAEHESYKADRDQLEPDHDSLRAMALKLRIEEN